MHLPNTISLLLLLLLVTSKAYAEKAYSIGTGSKQAIYYPSATKLSQIFNEKTKLKLQVQESPGSVFNINAVMAKNLDLGFSQADRLLQAYKGEGDWQAKGPQQELRLISNLHPEFIVLIARTASGIKTLADLKNKKVNIGNPGSGQRANAIDVLNAFSPELRKEIESKNQSADDAIIDLQNAKLDAVFQSLGQPYEKWKQLGKKNEFQFIAIENLDAALIEKNIYKKNHIEISHYPQFANTSNVPTYSLSAQIFTSIHLDTESAYLFTKTLFENIESLKSADPALKNLNSKEMATPGAVPFHPGAIKYFKEQKLIP